MPNNIPNGHFRGLGLIQKSGNVGGFKNVFVNLVGNHNDIVYPHIGGKVMNPPKGRAKMWAGDLLEYRPKVGSDLLDPEIYILRTFKVADAVSEATTVYILRDEFKHKPFVGDCLMVAPDVIGGEGTAVKVTAVTATTATIGGNATNVWQLTVSAAMTITKGAILVEAENFTEGTSATKAMLVKNINGVFDCDTDFFETDNIEDVTPTLDGGGNVTGYTDWDKARYQYTPSLGGLMWIHKMSPMPQCVLDLNQCNVANWFHVNWALNGKKIAGAEESAEIVAAVSAAKAAVEGELAGYHLSGETDPTTSTAAPMGAEYINTTDNGVFKCVAVSEGDTPSYTWVEVTVS